MRGGGGLDRGGGVRQRRERAEKGYGKEEIDRGYIGDTRREIGEGGKRADGSEERKEG